MSETTTATIPNIEPSPDLERQASILLTGIMDNPQSIGANVEDGSYSIVETENEVNEKIDIGSGHVGLTLHASRTREYDPQRYLPGKFGEGMTILASIPGIAQLTLVMAQGKVQAIEYSDPSGKKDGMDRLKDVLDAITIALEELKNRQVQ